MVWIGLKKSNVFIKKKEQLELWSKRYGDNFDLAWEFLEESKKVETDRKQKEYELAQQRIKASITEHIYLINL